MVSVLWSESALGDIDALDTLIRARILKKVTWLEKHFDDVVPEPLHRELKGQYKLRVGDYRIIYSSRTTRSLLKQSDTGATYTNDGSVRMWQK